MYEVELLAIHSLITTETLILAGAHNAIYSDHKALEGLGLIDLGNISNIRVLRLMEVILGYEFQVKYIKSTHNKIVDFLSRHPKTSTEAENYLGLVQPSLYGQSHQCRKLYEGRVQDTELENLASLAEEDEEYKQINEAISNGTDWSNLPDGYLGKELKDQWKNLTNYQVENGTLDKQMMEEFCFPHTKKNYRLI